MQNVRIKITKLKSKMELRELLNKVDFYLCQEQMLRVMEARYYDDRSQKGLSITEFFIMSCSGDSANGIAIEIDDEPDSVYLPAGCYSYEDVAEKSERVMSSIEEADSEEEALAIVRSQCEKI